MIVQSIQLFVTTATILDLVVNNTSHTFLAVILIYIKEYNSINYSKFGFLVRAVHSSAFRLKIKNTFNDAVNVKFTKFCVAI